MTPLDKISSIGGDRPSVDAYQAYQNMMNARAQNTVQQAASPAASSPRSAETKQPDVVVQKQGIQDISSYKEFKQRVDRLNEILDTKTNRLSFDIEGNVFLLKIVDDAGNVVKQIPSKEMVEFMNRMEQEVSAKMARG